MEPCIDLGALGRRPRSYSLNLQNRQQQQQNPQPHQSPHHHTLYHHPSQYYPSYHRLHPENERRQTISISNFKQIFRNSLSAQAAAPPPPLPPTPPATAWMQLISQMPLKTNGQNSLKLNSFECGQLEAIHRAVALIEPTSAVADTLEAQIREKVTKFCHQLPIFRELIPVHQQQMLHSLQSDVLTLLTAFYFGADCAVNKATLPECFSKSTQEQLDMFASLYRQIDSDATIKNLLIALKLVANFDGKVHQNYVRYQRFFYSYLLQRYLQHKYGSIDVSVRKYAALMQLMRMDTFKELPE